MSPLIGVLVLALATGVAVLVAELRALVVEHRRRVRGAQFRAHLDEAIEVAMGRHPSRVRGPEDDEEWLRTLGGGR